MPTPRQSTRLGHIDLARKVLAIAHERGMRRGDHLPEQLLSELCGVSRTPIRSAFKILFENDFLTWREEEGYFLELDDAESLLQAQRRLEEFEQSLAQTILTDRSLRRIGEVESVNALMRKYGASRHIVQNALKVLSQDGIVTQLPGRSWSFQPLLDSPRAQEQSLNFRMAIEPQAILEPNFRLDPKKAGVLRLRMQDMLQAREGGIGSTTFLALDTDFHSFVGECSGNQFARNAIIAHHRLRRATQRAISIPDFRLRQALKEHIEILESLQTGQFELAADLMLVHLRRSRTVRPETVNRGAPPMVRGVRA